MGVPADPGTDTLYGYHHKFYKSLYRRRRSARRSQKTDVIRYGDGDAACRASLETAWGETRRATERWNDTSEACAFTAFHGWEHSYSVNMSKVHRNVIFRNASSCFTNAS